MDAIKEINQKINKLFETETAYSISKNSGLPRQTVTDLMTGKSDIKKAKFITIEKLYEYAKGVLEMSQKEKQIVMEHLNDLLPIMEETTDKETKNRIDEKITELMKNLNLTWDDMG